MARSFFNRGSIKVTLFLFGIFFVFTIILIFSGYFEIGLMSDDYLNFMSAQNSSLREKLTSSVPYYSNLHLRPVWFLMINAGIRINDLLGFEKGNFVLFRIENLIYFYLLILIGSILFYRTSRNITFSIAFALVVLLYPNNINDICWTVGKVDLLCAIFLFASVYFAFRYGDFRKNINIWIAVGFFILALLTKETAIILPLVTMLMLYICYGKERVFDAKLLITAEFAVLILYAVYRIMILGTQPSEVVTKFQRPGFFSTGNVIFKAFISLLMPFDYLSIQYYITTVNPVFAIYSALMIILLVAILFVLIRTMNFKYLFTLSLLFLVLIVPNIIAGYFRPQLILIPFVFFIFCLLMTMTFLKSNMVFMKIVFVLIIILNAKLSYNLIQEWKFAYEKSVTAINKLVEKNLDPQRKNIVLGLPSRFKQSAMLDYARGAYNYWKFGKFKLVEPLYDLILVGSLDPASLNSALYVNELNDREFEVFVSGETQYFAQLDGGNKYKDRDIDIRLLEKNAFRKPAYMRIRLLSGNVDVYVDTQNELIKINK